MLSFLKKLAPGRDDAPPPRESLDEAAVHRLRAACRLLPNVSGGSDVGPWRWLVGYFRDSLRHIALHAVVTSAQSLLMLPMLLLARMAIDRAIPHGRTGLLIAIGTGLLGMRVASGWLALLMRRRIARIVRSAIMRMRHDQVARLYERPHISHLRARQVEIYSQVVFDTERIEVMADTVLAGALSALLTGAVLAAVALWLDAWLTALAAALLPLVWLAGQVTTRRMQANVRNFHAAHEAFTGGMRFVLECFDLTRARAAEADEVSRQAQHLRGLRDAAVRLTVGNAGHGFWQSSVTGLIGIAVLVAGGMAVGRGAITLGDFLAFSMAATLAMGQIDRLLAAVPAVVEGREALRRLYRAWCNQPPPVYCGRRRIVWRGHLALSHVRFGYGAAPLLRDVSLTLDATADVAIVGPNGSGKTTILNLILGFHRPQAGTIAADGIDYAELDLNQLRRAIGLVPQHPRFFAGSLAENIGYGIPGIRATEIERAAVLAGATPLLQRLSRGLDAQIGEGGVLLSGGERQKLAIARALAGGPRLLILDEPTNHLDRPAIKDLMATLAALPDRPAVLLISHDPAVVRCAHTVYRLASGRLDIEHVALRGDG
jgi:ABC-type bacteriocin/lantibiotic exporter with double-glycine peptidase domain